MWRTSCGNRVLTDPEWELYATGLDRLRDEAESDLAVGADDVETGVAAFDRLTAGQKLALLADTARVLRDPAVPPPRHTAANEGAIQAVFTTLWADLAADLDADDGGPGPADLRPLLLAAYGDGRDDPPPDPRSADREEWTALLEEIEARVFWDADFELGDYFLDLPPDVARERLRVVGIDPDYFLTVSPDPGESGLTAARQTLARLLGLAVPNDDGLYPAIVDLYHDLAVGPISPEDISRWEDRPWVQVHDLTAPGWDCPFTTWASLFAAAIPDEPFEPAPAAGDTAYELPLGVTTERLAGGWVLRNEDGAYWCDLIDDMWTDGPEDEDLPAISYDTESDLKAAYHQATRMYDEREKRREEALTRLEPPIE
jgi:hypothetical protein